MINGGFSTYLNRSRRTSIISLVSISIAGVAMISLLLANISFISVIGTVFTAGVAACATWAQSHYRTQKYVRFAIRARLAKKAEPDFERLTRQYRALGKYVQKSAHPSPEIADALKEATKCMGLSPGSVLALVVPLELILGVPHNCPSAAAMLYAGRHPVILIDDELQKLLDNTDDYEKQFNLVVSVLCHEIAHLLSWNTRWARSVGIGDLFVRTTALIAIVTYALEHTFIFGIVGAFIAGTILISEPALMEERTSPSNLAIVARLAILAWVPYIFIGIIISALPFSFTLSVISVSLGLRFVLAILRRREELYADAISAHALGSSSPLTDFFRSLSSHHPNLWSKLFSTHPTTSTRIKYLRNTGT